jgi:hypothetical protein
MVDRRAHIPFVVSSILTPATIIYYIVRTDNIMADCKNCGRSWNSWGGGYEFCNEKCHSEHWNKSLQVVSERYNIHISTLANLVADLVDVGAIRINDNY